MLGAGRSSRRKEGNVDNEWDRLEERLGSPENSGASRRAAELTANGWRIETVLFRTGRWTFRRPRRAEAAPSMPVAPAPGAEGGQLR